MDRTGFRPLIRGRRKLTRAVRPVAQPELVDGTRDGPACRGVDVRCALRFGGLGSHVRRGRVVGGDRGSVGDFSGSGGGCNARGLMGSVWLSGSSFVPRLNRGPRWLHGRMGVWAYGRGGGGRVAANHRCAFRSLALIPGQSCHGSWVVADGISGHLCAIEVCRCRSSAGTLRYSAARTHFGRARS
jgi:hypothetical protein